MSINAERHHEHALHCDCRKPPPKLAAQLAGYETRSTRGFPTR